eukprot:MONOS_12849.1-p1 / transcript=MONOS_12849.1 / gene=MONOS_12849 / organism=Monocercomonoides_exilis_PA203 / gene_product=unspecified product / transcript_product=unspecified product / location=Mono_scaffold00742:15264-17158(+) / protein_length=299 / sequence_SO=supercontig / SO=protein_coding / is_pseudo=false
MSCLLKLALKKEESEETQKEVEMALLTLSRMGYCFIERELYLKEIEDIMEYQQKHRNLTRLAYWSVWDFLIHRLLADNSLEEVIVNELHFGREAARELEELTRNVNWNRKKGEEMNKEEANEVLIYRAAKDNCRDISNLCMYPLRYAAKNRDVKVEDLLKGGAIDAILEEIQRQTLNEAIVNDCFQFLVNVSRKLKEKNKDEREEEERKALNRKVFEKMEEEGLFVKNFKKEMLLELEKEKEENKNDGNKVENSEKEDKDEDEDEEEEEEEEEAGEGEGEKEGEEEEGEEENEKEEEE